MLGQTYITSREVRGVVMQTSEPVSTKEATDRLVKIFDIIYAESDLERLSAKATHMDAENIT